MDSKIYLAVDFGRKTTSCGVAASDWETIFESGYDRSDRSSGEENEILIDRKNYLRFGGGRKEVEPNPLDSDRMLNCTLYGCAQYLADNKAQSGEYTFFIGCNVPILQYGAEKKAFVEYYTGKEVEVVYKTRIYRIRIDGAVAFPQGIVAVQGTFGKYKAYNELLILDIGSRTIDYVVQGKSPSGKTEFREMKSLDNGVIGMFDAIDYRLRQDRIQIPESSIENAVKGIDVSHKKNDIIQRVAKEKRAEYVQSKVINALYQNGVDTGMATLLIGGGSDLISEELTKEMFVVGNLGVMANMRGIRAALEHIKERS